MTRSPEHARRTAQDVGVEWLFRSAWAASRVVPQGIRSAAFTQLADTLWKRQAADVRQLEANIARVRPGLSAEQLRELSRQSLRSYMRYWREAFEVAHWPAGHVRSAFTMENPDVIDAVLEHGRGAILVATHSGSWDLAGAWAADRYGRVTTVAERLKPEGLYRQFVKHREAFGAEIFPTGTPDVIETLAARLDRNGVVALMGDRDISRRGLAVPLFGELASLPAGPAVLALRSGAPLLPMDLWYGDDGAPRARAQEPIELPSSGTQAERVHETVARIARAFETSLSAHVVDWHMMQPVWVADLDPSKRSQPADLDAPARR